MSEAAIREKLDACLIEDFLEKPEKYESLDDPFPKWAFTDEDSGNA